MFPFASLSRDNNSNYAIRETKNVKLDIKLVRIKVNDGQSHSSPRIVLSPVPIVSLIFHRTCARSTGWG